MKHLKTPFQPLSTERLHEMAQTAVQYPQAFSLASFLKGLIPEQRGAWAPAAAFAAMAMLAIALRVAENMTPQDDLVASVEQADVLVMLEENIY